jgi:hypothetical protein
MTGVPHIVGDVMTTAVVSVDPDTPFKEIVRILRQGHVSAVPVVAAAGAVVGVVSEADLLAKEEFRGSDPRPGFTRGWPCPTRGRSAPIRGRGRPRGAGPGTAPRRPNRQRRGARCRWLRCCRK